MRSTGQPAGRRGLIISGAFAWRETGVERMTEPDCGICIHREDCPLAMLGYFCTRFQSHEPEPKGEDPSEAWRWGEEVDGL